MGSKPIRLIGTVPAGRPTICATAGDCKKNEVVDQIA